MVESRVGNSSGIEITIIGILLFGAWMLERSNLHQAAVPSTSAREMGYWLCFLSLKDSFRKKKKRIYVAKIGGLDCDG